MNDEYLQSLIHNTGPITTHDGVVSKTDWDFMMIALDEHIERAEKLRQKLDLMDDDERLEWLNKNALAVMEE